MFFLTNDKDASNISSIVPSTLLLSSNLCPISPISPSFLPGTTTQAIKSCGRYPWGYSPNTIIPASVGLIFPVLFSIIPFNFKIFSSENFERLGLSFFILVK